MIDKGKHIRQLTSLGLSENEAKTYMALLTKNSMTVGEIAKISGVPRPKLYGILTKLIERGICDEKIGNIKRYRVVAPNIVAERLIGDYQVKLQQKKVVAQNFSNTVHSIYETNIDKTDPLEYIEIIKNKELVRKKFLDNYESVKKEILGFTKPPYALSLEDVTSGEIEKQAKAEGKKLKIFDVCEYNDRMSNSDKEEFWLMIHDFVSNGEEVRIVEELPMKLFIFDEKITIFALDDPISLKPTLTTMVVNHRGFAKSLRYLFESIWEKALPFEEFKKRNEE